MNLHGDEFARKIRDDGCRLRVLIIDPEGEMAGVESKNGFDDDRLKSAPARARESLKVLRGIHQRLQNLSTNLEVRIMNHSPAFSLMIIDPNTPDGVVQVQILSHRSSSGSRPILRLKADGQRRWYRHFVEQFEEVWGFASEIFRKQEECC